MLAYQPTSGNAPAIGASTILGVRSPVASTPPPPVAPNAFGATVAMQAPANLPPAEPRAAAKTQAFSSTVAMPSMPDAPAQRAGSAKQTMLGISAPPTASHASAPPPASERATAQTMLGVAVPGVAPIADAPAAKRPAPQTMLGVAVPGVAPIAEAAAPRRAAPQTMLGVAAPGIAPSTPPPGYSPSQPPGGASARPLSMTMSAPPEVLPAPAPIYDEPLPEAPTLPSKKGLPVALVAGIGGAVLLVGAGLAWFAIRNATPLTGIAKLSAEGKEQLHLSCESCADGTVVTLGSARATFAGHSADLDTSELKVGDNEFTLGLDRPSLGRDEHVKLVVPVAYRVRGDLSKIGATPPLLEVLVEAKPGDTATVDGKPVTLDASGHGVVTVDVTADVQGEADDAKVVEKSFAYVVSGPKGEVGKGAVSAKFGVPKLRIDAPGPRATTEDTNVNVAGRTAKGTKVTINGQVAPVGDDGVFAVRAPVPAGEAPTLVIRAQAMGQTGELAPRVLTIPIHKVASLKAEADSLEKKNAPGYDDLMKDLGAARGKDVVLEGSVIEARTQNHSTVMLIDDRRGCGQQKPCVARVIYGGPQPVAKDERVRVYGVVRGPFTAPGTAPVPEVVADFLLKGKSR